MFTIDASYVPVFYACFALVIIGGMGVVIFNLLSVRKGILNFRLNALIAAIIFIGAGGLVAWAGWQQVVTAYQSSAWPTTTGVIISANMSSDETTTTRGNVSSGGSRTSSTTVYGAAVIYEYRVDDRLFSSNQIAIGQGSSNRPEYAQQILARYPVGREVKVHYSPTDPASAVLEPGLSLKAFFTFGLGLIFMLVGLAAAYLYRFLGSMKISIGRKGALPPYYTEDQPIG